MYHVLSQDLGDEDWIHVSFTEAAYDLEETLSRLQFTQTQNKGDICLFLRLVYLVCLDHKLCVGRDSLSQFVCKMPSVALYKL